MFNSRTLLTVAASVVLATQTQAVLLNSFEGTTHDWGLGTATGAAISSDNTAPAAAITDGTYALKLEHTDIAGEAPVAFMDHTASPDFHAALKDISNDTLSVDIFVPWTSVQGDSWGNVTLRLQGGGFTSTSAVFDIPNTLNVNKPGWGVDNQFTLTIDLTAFPDAGRLSSSWAQLTLLTNGPLGASGYRGAMPFYADNFQIYAVPEPGTLMLAGLGSLCLMVRRRRLQA